MLPNTVPWLQALRRSCAAGMLAALAACGGGSSSGSSVTLAPPQPTVAAPDPLGVDWPPITMDIDPAMPSLFELHAIGGDSKRTWTARCGAHLDCSIQEGSKLRVASLAGSNPVESFITLNVTDGKGAQGTRTVPVVAWPKAMTVTSLLGAPDRPGIHLLILNDGFLPAELGLFHEAAAGMLKELFSHPEIAAHREAWNVHVADFIVLDDTTGQPKASPLGATLGCLGLARSICVEQARVQRAATAVLPHYTSALLIINNTSYGGSGGGGVAAITRYSLSAEIAVHELGHSFAGLADEYVDAAFASPFLQINAPNVTRHTERNDIPWRHWIDAATPLPTPVDASTMAQNFVGLFEGGGYVAKGMYRATYDSFMRSNNLVGPVNGEAWARSVYAKGGAWRRVAPAVTTPLTRDARPAGGWIFEAQPLLDRSIAETRWYVDGVERTEQRGAGQLMLTESGALQVRVDLVDLTGRVRLEQGVVNTLKWTVP